MKAFPTAESGFNFGRNQAADNRPNLGMIEIPAAYSAIHHTPALGENISQPEVTNVSSHGVWLLSGNKELFMSYEDFPWFKDVPVGKILNVEEVSPGHLYWPDLDVDIGIETIEHPERFPLKAK